MKSRQSPVNGMAAEPNGGGGGKMMQKMNVQAGKIETVPVGWQYSPKKKGQPASQPS
jgi:hypothetical protein